MQDRQWVRGIWDALRPLAAGPGVNPLGDEVRHLLAGGLGVPDLVDVDSSCAADRVQAASANITAKPAPPLNFLILHSEISILHLNK